MKKSAYKRILLKLSGESLMGKQKFGVDAEACQQIASSVKDLLSLGVQIGVVIGGGNIFRGINASKASMQRVPADQIGMLATLINALSLQQAFERLGCKSRVLSAIPCEEIAETYCWKKSLKYLDEGNLLIFAGGTGNPFFTTDSAAALRALEIQADILMKATQVEGIYNKDPKKYPDAVKFDRLSYSDVLAKKLEVMDATAIALCRENRIPIRVFSGSDLKRAILDPSVGTHVEDL